ASLRESEREPTLLVNPDDAAARGIADGAQVRVFNDRGSLQLTARVSDRIRPGVVSGAGIWWHKFSPGGRNVNAVTSQALTDLGAAATFYDCLVEVSAVD
ncbi:MAG TPA: molybdopterin dinucleotide binding domain-containing protein, partial [Burkholderiaceae bacterium]|nr:molybdopterin dinucleotide binding domain-containing protein [Burkholderiaceae bacterium]